MTDHPYKSAAPYQRWRAAMAGPAFDEVDPVTEPPFRLAAGEKVATAGSCFAQNVGARLASGGLVRLVTEPAHAMLPAETAAAFGYGVYTARFGNIYTARQLLQLFRRAFGRFTPSEAVWAGPDGRAFDPFRPACQPGGFSTVRELELDRAQHLAAVREMFLTADALMFTLGLTECWVSADDGAVFPVCPGVSAGEFDPARHRFVNLSLDEVVADLRAFLGEVRALNPGLKVVLTVSPVPLAATAEPRHVWTATTWSKAVLRLAAEAVCDTGLTTYFPAYEVVTAPSARGRYFDDDLRSVRPEGVDHVMRLFFRHMVEGADQAPPPPPPAPSAGKDFLARAAAAVNVICEEAALDGAWPSPTDTAS